MYNITFELNQNINKEKLAKFLYEQEYINVPSLINDSVGLKIKIPYKHPVSIRTIEFANKRFTDKDPIYYNTFFASNCKKLARSFGTSVTIFPNGKVAMSGVDKTVVEWTIAWLQNVLEKAKDQVIYPPKLVKTFKR